MTDLLAGVNLFSEYYRELVKMTEELKLAEEYTEEIMNEYLNEIEVYEARREIFIAFFSGLNAKIQWHDLRKNPDDLPKGDIHRKILVKDRLNNIYTACWFPKDDCHKEDCFSVEWLDYGFQGCNFCAKEQIIAWCEKFE